MALLSQFKKMNSYSGRETIGPRSHDHFLYCAPVDVVTRPLANLVLGKLVVLIGSADQEAEALFTGSVGLRILTCLKFSADRHSELIQLYLL